MEILIKHSNKAQILILSGRLDGKNPKMLKERLAKELLVNNRIIVDLSDVTYIDSSGLGVLVGGLKKALSEEGDIRLINPSVEVKMLMEMTRVDRVFLIFPDLENALESYTLTGQ
jgi:anti-sigma B factor antagonist